MLCVILITCSSCSQLSLLASGTSLAISQNSYAKIYNAADVLTIMSTDESIKKHAYKNIKKVKALKDIERRRQILLADLEKLNRARKAGL